MKKLLATLITCTFSQLHADIVEKVEFQGLDRVEPEAIEDCLTIKPNKNYDQSDIDATLKALFSKDFFSYIKFIKRDRVLIIKCTEKPMVDKVAFEGNDAASDDMLKNMLNGRVGEGRLFSLHIIKDILSDFLAAYKSLGYCSAKITPRIIRHPGNKIDIVFEVKEGPKTTIKKILFVGNKTFSDDELKDLLSTKEEKIWRFWDYDSHVFREDRIEVDVEALTTFYKSKGFPFFVVTSTSTETDFDKKSYFCTFILEEGDRYNIKSVILESKVKNIKAEDFKKYISVKSGTVYNESLINADKEIIRDAIGMKDNPFIDVVVDIKYDKVSKTADIKYFIVKIPKAFIERIEIVGNTVTLDKVIRREFSVYEGDAYNVYKIQRTVERLKSIGYFEDVQVSDSPGSTEDKKNLVITVKEKENTAHLRFGLNMSDADGLGGFVGIVENNLMGTGRTVSADVFWMQKHYGCKFDVFDPYFMDKDFGAGLSFGVSQYDRKNVDGSVYRSVSLSPYIRYRIRDHLWHRIAYTITSCKRRWWSKEEKKLYDKVPDHVGIKRIMKDEYGKYVTSEASSTLIYDKTDNSYEPRNGYDISFTNAFSGVGGNVSYLKTEISGNFYYPLSKRLTFVTNASIGYMKEIKNTRSGNRYALGGDGESMRGFDSCGVGPKDLQGDSVGGNKYWTLSFMVKAPLSTREMGINGVVFLDFGSAWGSKYDKSSIRDSSSIRCSTGMSIEWARSPIGIPIKFVFGFPLKKKPFDEKQTFTLAGFMQ